MPREPFVMEPHAWHNLRGIPWRICWKCGLVWLRNPFTQWAVKHGCNNEDHPSHDKMRTKFTRL